LIGDAIQANYQWYLT